MEDVVSAQGTGHRADPIREPTFARGYAILLGAQ